MKVFVQASPEVRARRRVDELLAKGESVSYEEVLANVCERDRIDTTRKESPLRRAADALLLDNDHLTREQQMEWLLKEFSRITGK
jgi:cytidylate kinase